MNATSSRLLCLATCLVSLTGCDDKADSLSIPSDPYGVQSIAAFTENLVLSADLYAFPVGAIQHAQAVQGITLPGTWDDYCYGTVTWTPPSQSGSRVNVYAAGYTSDALTRASQAGMTELKTGDDCWVIDPDGTGEVGLLNCKSASTQVYEDETVSWTLDEVFDGGEQILHQLSDHYSLGWSAPTLEGTWVWGGGKLSEEDGTGPDPYNLEWHENRQFTRMVDLQGISKLWVPALGDAHVSLGLSLSSITGPAATVGITLEEGTCDGYRYRYVPEDPVTSNPALISSLDAVWMLIVGWSSAIPGTFVQHYTGSSFGHPEGIQGPASAVMVVEETSGASEYTETVASTEWVPEPLPYVAVIQGGHFPTGMQQYIPVDDDGDDKADRGYFARPIYKIHMSGDTNLYAGTVKSLDVSDLGSFDGVAISYPDGEGGWAYDILGEGDSWESSKALGVFEDRIKLWGLFEDNGEEGQILDFSDPPTMTVEGVGVTGDDLITWYDGALDRESYKVNSSSLGLLGTALEAAGVLSEDAAVYLSVAWAHDCDDADGNGEYSDDECPSLPILSLLLPDGGAINLPLTEADDGSYTFDSYLHSNGTTVAGKADFTSNGLIVSQLRYDGLGLDIDGLTLTASRVGS